MTLPLFQNYCFCRSKSAEPPGTWYTDPCLKIYLSTCELSKTTRTSLSSLCRDNRVSPSLYLGALSNDVSSLALFYNGACRDIAHIPVPGPQNNEIILTRPSENKIVNTVDALIRKMTTRGWKIIPTKIQETAA